MGTDSIVLGVVVASAFVLLWFANPFVLMDRVRNRRDETIRRQIALTEAIDGQLGPIVAPVVQKPLWGPWQIRIAVPITQPAAVGTILAVAHEVFTAADRMSPDRYEIVLTPKRDSTPRRWRHAPASSQSDDMATPSPPPDKASIPRFSQSVPSRGEPLPRVATLL